MDESRLYTGDGQRFERDYPWIAVGCACIGLGIWESVGADLRLGAPWAEGAPADNLCQRFVLVGFAALAEHEGQPERAVELCSLAVNHPLSPPWWPEREPLTHALMARLQKALTAEAYDAAWARGKMLDLKSVIAVLTH